MSMGNETRETHAASTGGVNRRAFLETVASVAAGAAVLGGIPERAAAQTPSGSPQQSKSHPRGGHLYMQTNETKNAIIHYQWAADGTLTEVERVATGGAGSGELSPIYHINRPNDHEG